MAKIAIFILVNIFLLSAIFGLIEEGLFKYIMLSGLLVADVIAVLSIFDN